jgi:hypothetical protein
MNKNIARIVQLITSEIRTQQDKKEKWASFKKKHASELKTLLELDHTDFENPGTLLGFDIDEERGLILLNYTGQAHNELHDVEGGWSQPLREMRGLIYNFTTEVPTLVSRGFEKFFNANELPENTYEALREKCGQNEYVAREKADGHMIEYFLHNGDLCATTRGKFGTTSSIEALSMFTVDDFNRMNNTIGGDLLSVVVELVTPNTEVHVDYDGQETLYLLAAYTSDGTKLPLRHIEMLVSDNSELFTLPHARMMTLDQMIEEINDRSIHNNEGWVMDLGGQLIKFKYIDYIGQMVKSKLSYKYIMNCIRNERLEKMFHTLPEELREFAYNMVDDVWKKAEVAKAANDHKVLYTMHSDLEGSTAYFQTVCRGFFRECVI